jgi:hypothetical protein
MKAQTAPRNPLTNFVKNIEFNRFGLICIVIILIGCFGGIAIGQGAIEHLCLDSCNHTHNGYIESFIGCSTYETNPDWYSDLYVY